MSDIPYVEAPFHIDAIEGEEANPGVGGLERRTANRITVVERFGKAEEVNKPVDADDDRGDIIAPSPIDVFGCEATSDRSNMGTVCYTGCGVSRKIITEARVTEDSQDSVDSHVSGTKSVAETRGRVTR